MNTILARARLVLPDEVIHGSVSLLDGLIVSIDTGPGVPAGAIDCEGDLLLPGLIELHTDNLERHMQPRPKVDWPVVAAIIAHDAELCSTGITTVFDALRVGSVVTSDTASMNDYGRRVADEIMALRDRNALRISHFLHLRAEVCSETLIAELARFHAQDGIGILSLMDHTPGQRQFRDVNQLRAYMRGKHGLSEEGFLAQIAEQRAMSDKYGAAHERTAVAEARRFGAALASHDDTTADQVATSARHGASFAEFPTTIEAAQACHDHGIKVMRGAPNLIRGGSHSGNVAAETLAKADLLDIMSSDYVPAAPMASALQLGEIWDDMPRGVATVTSAPAAVVGLADRGQIAVGLRADVIRVREFGQTPAICGVWVAGQRVG